ncbi:MAG: methyltransferase [Clostridia bacterium]|nr:methyltransferase [Clostridia bacterium]
MDESIKFEPLGNGVKVAVSKHHTFGTDAILLANFSNAKNGDSLIDLGTGCGIIPFVIMRDKKLKSAVGVDISKEAVDLANIGARENGFENFSAICSDINDLKGKVGFGSNTLVTFNPPYKAKDAGLESRDITVRTARHETAGNMASFVEVAAKLLQTGGRLCMCQRPERAAELITLMAKNKVEPKRMRLVSKKVGERPWLVLLEGKRSAKTGLVIEPTLYLYDNKGDYTEDMLNIYGIYKEQFL